MATFLYCPRTALIVQGFVADDPMDDNNQYIALKCLACRATHLVDPVAGKVLGQDDEE
jgi:hypothetical protein